jgi:hypothetical protein
MEEAPENAKELLHSEHANGMNEWTISTSVVTFSTCSLFSKHFYASALNNSKAVHLNKPHLGMQGK